MKVLMKYFVEGLGLIIHVVVLISVLDIFIAPDNERLRDKILEACPPSPGPARRSVIIMTPGLSLISEAGRSLAEPVGPPFSQSQLMAITAGLRKHPLFYSFFSDFDNILKKADLVVYSGPSFIPNYFKEVNWMSSSFHQDWMHLSTEVQENDKFVFDSIQNILFNTSNITKNILKGKIIFLLYLTSIDLCWQKFGENSDEFKNANAFVEKEFYRMKKDLENYFNDRSTIFLTTSLRNKEHGIPVAILGNGIKSGPMASITLIDLCPLLAYLLGLPIPLTSQGSLPLFYLNLTEEETAQALICNALQLFQLAFGREILDKDKNVKVMNTSLQEKKFKECIEMGKSLIEISQSKIKSTLLPVDHMFFYLILLSLLGWTFLLLSEVMILEIGKINPSEKIKLVIELSFLLFAVSLIFCSIVKWPCRSYHFLVYSELPLIPWFFVLYRYNVFYNWFTMQAKLKIIYYVLGMPVMAEIFYYVLQNIISPTFLIASIAFLTISPGFQKTPFIYSVGWYTLSSLIILLNYIPLNGKPTTKIVNFSGTILLCITGGISFGSRNIKNVVITVIFIFLIAVSMLVCDATILVTSTPIAFQVTSWILLFSVFLPLIGTEHVPDRLVHTGMAFIIPVFLLSGQHEPISYIAFLLYALSWIFLERSYLRDSITWHDIRRGLILFYMFVIGYVLMGKVDSRTDLNLLWFRCFLHEENIYSMYALLYLKYISVFVVLMTLYESFLSKSHNGIISFIHCLIIADLLSLMALIKFHLTNISSNVEENIFQYIFIQVFTISILLSRILSKIYAGRLETKQIEQIDGPPSSESLS